MLNDSDIDTRSSVGKRLISPYDFSLLQPHSYDATLGADIKLARYTNGVPSWESIQLTDDGYDLQPGGFALGTTQQYFTLPVNIVGFVQGKSTIGRNGLQIENAGLIDAGFEGNITLELYNMAPWPIVLKKDMRICQIHFTSAKAPVFKNYKIDGHYNKQTGATLPSYAITRN